MAITFANYGWNASPVDGTDIIRSFAAIGREFPFPIDLAQGEHHLETPEVRPGDDAIEHLQTIRHMMTTQQAMLQVINDERRAYHRDRLNKLRTQTRFNTGDLVIVRRQVKSDKSRGVVAKLQIRATGPYKVIREGNPGSYWVRRIPFLEGEHTMGVELKESVARMEFLPDMLRVQNMYMDWTLVYKHWITNV